MASLMDVKLPLEEAQEVLKDLLRGLSSRELEITAIGLLGKKIPGMKASLLGRTLKLRYGGYCCEFYTDSDMTEEAVDRELRKLKLLLQLGDRSLEEVATKIAEKAAAAASKLKGCPGSPDIRICLVDMVAYKRMEYFHQEGMEYFYKEVLAQLREHFKPLSKKAAA